MTSPRDRFDNTMLDLWEEAMRPPPDSLYWHELQLAEWKQREQAARHAVRKAQDRVKYHKRRIEEAKQEDV